MEAVHLVDLRPAADLRLRVALLVRLGHRAQDAAHRVVLGHHQGLGVLGAEHLDVREHRVVAHQLPGLVVRDPGAALCLLDSKPHGTDEESELLVLGAVLGLQALCQIVRHGGSPAQQ